MEENELKNQYISEFDNIHASEDLKNSVKNLKPQKRYRRVTPLKATIGTVAAAVMIVIAVHDYTFEPDTTGVISEKTVSTQLPEAQFGSVEQNENQVETTTPKETTAPKTKDTEKPNNMNNANNANNANNTAVAVKPSSTNTTARPTEKPVVTQSPTPTQTPIVEDKPEVQAATAPDEQVAVAKSINDDIYPTVKKWNLNDYYEYLGVDVSQRIAGTYTGAQSFEFEIGSDGIPMDDTAVLSFVTNTGANVRATVSKHVLFDASLSGTVNEVGSGFNAYKVSGGVYYNVYVTNTTLSEVNSIISGL